MSLLAEHEVVGIERKTDPSEMPESVFWRLEWDLFNAQVFGTDWLAQQIRQGESVDVAKLYELFQSPYAQTTEPELAALEALEEMLPLFAKKADRIEKEWRNAGFERWLEDVTADGEHVWVFNSDVVIKPDVVEPVLKKVFFDGKQYQLWHVAYQVSPMQDEHGAYVPFDTGEQVNVLAAFGAPAEPFGINLDESYQKAFELAESDRFKS